MRFKHFKGGEYEFISLAFRETEIYAPRAAGGSPFPYDGSADVPRVIEAVVVYRNIDSGDIWVRPAREFFGDTSKATGVVSYDLRFTPLVPPKKTL
jgi:hypothetical protein